jgi:hypothetical protein
MIFDDEIQQMRGFGLDAGVGGFAKHALVKVAQQRVKGIAPLPRK